jgi:hypothetical protein
MDMLLNALILLLLVEKLKTSKLMLSSLPITLSKLPLEPSRSEAPIKMLPQLSPKFAKHTESTQFKVFSHIKLRNI